MILISCQKNWTVFRVDNSNKFGLNSSTIGFNLLVFDGSNFKHSKLINSKKQVFDCILSDLYFSFKNYCFVFNFVGFC